MGWTADIALAKGVAQTYAWYLEQLDKGAAVRAN
jgi:dTDP-D-glucose 4,6-dehydratase